jgi:hypothetical protein
MPATREYDVLALIRSMSTDEINTQLARIANDTRFTAGLLRLAMEVEVEQRAQTAILCAAHTDPYILEQAYEQDDENEYCNWCENNPCTCPEPDIAGEVTGYDNGPTFW